jgi:hypothetical protein
MIPMVVSCGGCGGERGGEARGAGVGVILEVGAEGPDPLLWYGRTRGPILAHSQLGGRILGVLLLFFLWYGHDLRV